MTCFFELSRLAVEVADFDFGQADEEELQYKTFWERLRESFGIYLYYTWTFLVSIFIQKWQSKFNAISTWCQGKDIWKFRILENVNVSKWNIHPELQLMLLVDVKYFFYCNLCFLYTLNISSSLMMGDSSEIWENFLTIRFNVKWLSNSHLCVFQQIFPNFVCISGAHFTSNASDVQSEGSSVSGRRSVQMPGELGIKSNGTRPNVYRSDRVSIKILVLCQSSVCIFYC